MLEVIKRALPFLLTLIVGVFLGSLFKPISSPFKYNFTKSEYARSYSYHKRKCGGQYEQRSYTQKIPYKPHYSPAPDYTDAARARGFEGTVKLEVEFLSNGQIGEIKVLQGQPFGLTREAIKAAERIRFTPATENGMPVTTTEIVEYKFPATVKF